MTDLVRRSDALAAIRKEAWPEDGTYPPEDQDIQDAERATVNVCCEAIAALPAVAFDELVPFLKTANEASREQLIVLSTNILAALEPMAAPDPATIREAALERAANETFGVEREYGQADTFQSGVAAARDRILALIAKGAAE